MSEKAMSEKAVSEKAVSVKDEIIEAGYECRSGHKASKGWEFVVLHRSKPAIKSVTIEECGLCIKYDGISKIDSECHLLGYGSTESDAWELAIYLWGFE